MLTNILNLFKNKRKEIEQTEDESPLYSYLDSLERYSPDEVDCIRIEHGRVMPCISEYNDLPLRWAHYAIYKVTEIQAEIIKYLKLFEDDTTCIEIYSNDYIEYTIKSELGTVYTEYLKIHRPGKEIGITYETAENYHLVDGIYVDPKKIYKYK